jgi:large subunit ribosomal protein L29
MAMKPNELRELSVEELQARDAELSEQLFALRLQKVTGHLEKPSKVQEVRRDRARVLTVLQEKRSA